MEADKYLNSIGVAMKLASITLGAWQKDPSNAIAIPHRNTVTPVNDKPAIEEILAVIQNLSAYSSSQGKENLEKNTFVLLLENT